MCRLVEIVLHAAYITPEFGKFGCHPLLYHGVNHALPDILCRGQTRLSRLGHKYRADFKSEAVSLFSVADFGGRPPFLFGDFTFVICEKIRR